MAACLPYLDVFPIKTNKNHRFLLNLKLLVSPLPPEGKKELKYKNFPSPHYLSYCITSLPPLKKKL